MTLIFTGKADLISIILSSLLILIMIEFTSILRGIIRIKDVFEYIEIVHFNF